MFITKVSAIDFYGKNTTVIKNAANSAKEKTMDIIDEAMRPVNEFVNYNKSAYSVPTGEYPMEHIKITRHPYKPDDSVIANEYLKVKENISHPIQENIEFISESSMM